ncbi:MAG: Rrf2 family transcriptional regulator [Sphingobium sp.]
MQRDGRLSRMLHVLIHMDRMEGPVTSDAVAKMLGTNPVVVRRTMAGLRDAGYVRSEKGHGGGWTLERPLGAITMLDIHRAVGEPGIFAIGPATDAPECLVEQAVNASMADAFRTAEALLMETLGRVTLAEIAADFDTRFRALAPDGICARG